MRHSTHPVPVELPSKDRNVIVLQSSRNAFLYVDGFHEIDLNSLVKSQKRLKTGRPIPILDGRGRSFAKELVSKKQRRSNLVFTTIFSERKSVTSSWKDAHGFGLPFKTWLLFTSV